MSAYGDFKAGLIDDSEYTRLCREEALRDEYDNEDDEEVFEDDDIDEF